MFIYLCGPMTENTPEQADNWRRLASTQLRKAGFHISSPMRVTSMLAKSERIGAIYEKYGDVPELRPQAIVTRDQFDVRHADIVLANMTELGKAWREEGRIHTKEYRIENVRIPSIGSDFEIAWALILNTPVVLIAPDGNPYAEHSFLTGSSNVIRFKQLEEGINWIVSNMSIYLGGRS